MSLILEARTEGVVTLTLNLPEKRNPISDNTMVEALLAAVRKADADMSVRVVILTGAGSAFCAGGDIKQIAAGEGRVRYGDSEWLAKGPDAVIGTRLRVAGHDGTVLLVEHLH